jgi:hypothetical protein
MEGIVQKGEEAPRQGGEGEQEQQQSSPHEHLVNLLLHLGSRLCNGVSRYSENARKKNTQIGMFYWIFNGAKIFVVNEWLNSIKHRFRLRN